MDRVIAQCYGAGRAELLPLPRPQLQQAALCFGMLHSGSHEVGTPALELSLQNNSMIGR